MATVKRQPARRSTSTTKKTTPKAQSISNGKHPLLFATFSTKSANEISDKWEQLKTNTSQIKMDKNQENVIKAALQRENNIAVQATAGSGKTTLALAIAKSMGVEDVVVLNNHKIATRLNLIKTTLPKWKLDENKYMNILGWKREEGLFNAFYTELEQRCEKRKDVDIPSYFDLKQLTLKAIDLYRSRLVDFYDFDACEKMLIEWDINFLGFTDIIVPWICNLILEMTEEELNGDKDNETKIDFTDMLYYPVVNYNNNGYRSKITFDTIIVDEAQDTCPLEIELYKLISHENTKFIFLGQTEQTIYNFRGVAIDNYPQIIKDFNCQEFILGTSYRNPQCIIPIAKQYCDYHTAFKSNGAGKIEELEFTKIWDYLKEGDAVLCATNAPIIALALEGFKRKKYLDVKNHDIISDLARLTEKISKMKDFNYADFPDYCTNYFNKSIAIIQKYNPQSTQVDILNDKKECLLSCYDECIESNSIKELIDFIKEVLSADGKIPAMSIHASKGLEFNRLFILEWDKIDKCKPDASEVQKLSTRYRNFVGVTRIKITSGNSDSGIIHLVESKQTKNK